MELTTTIRTYRHFIKKHSEDVKRTSRLLKYVCRELRAFVSLYIRPKCLCTCKMNMFLKQKLPTRILDILGSVFCNFSKFWISEIHNSRRIIKAIYGAQHDYQNLPALYQEAQ